MQTETTGAQARPAAPQQPTTGGRPRRRFIGELPILIVVAVVIALLIKTFLLQAFYIPSESMHPTLREGDRVLVEKVGYRVGEPERGQVIVFERELVQGGREPDLSLLERVGNSFRGLFGWPTGSRQDFIKRVIAVEGETVEGRAGKVYVNDEKLGEPYLADRIRTSSFPEVQVPQGSVFVMGDNRGNSNDSRSFGPIGVDVVVGHAFLLVWPPQDFGTL